MTLQVIKAEDVRDGEPRMYAFDAKDADDRVASIAPWELHGEKLDGYPLAIVDRPAPFTAAQPPPVLDLDALAEDVAHLAKLDLVGELRGLVSAAPHLIAEARAVVALRAQICRLVSGQALESDHLCQHHDADVAALAEVAALREKLAEAKRLGLEACDGRLTSPRTSAAIRAELEKL